jgi:hypothetical protein
MPFYQCTICNEDGSPIADDVRVLIEVQEGGPGWYGTITATQLTALTAGHTYTITLGDGRKGTFRVKRNTVAGDVDRAIAITGAEPLA